MGGGLRDWRRRRYGLMRCGWGVGTQCDCQCRMSTGLVSPFGSSRQAAGAGVALSHSPLLCAVHPPPKQPGSNHNAARITAPQRPFLSFRRPSRGPSELRRWCLGGRERFSRGGETGRPQVYRVVALLGASPHPLLMTCQWDTPTPQQCLLSRPVRARPSCLAAPPRTSGLVPLRLLAAHWWRPPPPCLCAHPTCLPLRDDLCGGGLAPRQLL